MKISINQRQRQTVFIPGHNSRFVDPTFHSLSEEVVDSSCSLSSGSPESLQDRKNVQSSLLVKVRLFAQRRH